MKKLVLACALVTTGALCLQNLSSGHGGTYRGPGDTVPPGGGGAGGAPGIPGTGNPVSPGPTGPPTPGGASPGFPIGGGPTGAVSGNGSGGGPDLTLWQYWWGFNREPYLDLKAHVHAGSVTTGSYEFFLGGGQEDQSRDSLRPSEKQIRDVVVPALLQALETETSNDIVSGCLIALAKIGDARDEGGAPKSRLADEITKHLTSGNQEIQETAAVALGILANEEDIALLEALLFDDAAALRSCGVSYNGSVPDRTRAFAGYGLGLIGHRAGDEGKQAIVSALIRMLEGPARSFGQRDIPVACLTSLGLTPLPLDSTAAPVDLSQRVERPQQVTNRQEQILWLLGYFDNAHEEYLNRAQVPTAIARLLAGADNADWLRVAVGQRFAAGIGQHASGENEVVQSLILALGRIGDCDMDEVDVTIRAALMKVSDHVADLQARHFSLIALAQVAGRPGTGAGGPIAGLQQNKGTPRGFLQEKLAKGSSATRSWAALALGVLERALDDAYQPSSEESRGVLRAALAQARAPAEVGALALAVGLVRDPEGIPVLRETFDRIAEPEARGFTAVALGLVDDRGSVARITEVVERSKYQPDLLKSAAIGLGLLGDKPIVQDLIDMLKAAQALSSQAALASALGFIGDARSIDPLVALLQDQRKTDRARGFAAVALGIVGDKEALPWNARISVDINYRANTPTLTAPEEGTGILDIL